MFGWGPTVLRLALSVIFLAHGLPKLLPIWEAAPDLAVPLLQALGFEPTGRALVLVGSVEVAGGVMLLLGCYTAAAALVLAVERGLALWSVHVPFGFFLNWAGQPGVGHGIEYHLVLLGGLVSLVLTGAGELSVDGARARSREAEALGRARLRSRKVG